MKSLTNTYVAFTGKQAVQHFSGTEDARGGSPLCGFGNIGEWHSITNGASPNMMQPQPKR
ncbi:MAG TPA: hypothetical protein V6C76_07590 [Drouetiella sp.]